jgi:flagellin-specific chaperone FliS
LSQALAESNPAKIGVILPMLRQLEAAWSKAHYIASQGQLAVV